MRRHFASLSALAAHFEAVAAALPGAENAMLEQIGVGVEQKARGKIGTLQPGWPPLEAYTIELKGHSAPLLETGAMRDSISHSVGGNAVKIGSTDRKAPFHEFGFTHNRSGKFVGPRPFIGPSMIESKATNEKIILDGVIRTFRSAP